MSLNSMHKSFDHTYKKGYCPHFFNTGNNLDSVGSRPEPMFYGLDFMSGVNKPNFQRGMKG